DAGRDRYAGRRTDRDGGTGRAAVHARRGRDEYRDDRRPDVGREARAGGGLVLPGALHRRGVGRGSGVFGAVSRHDPSARDRPTVVAVPAAFVSVLLARGQPIGGAEPEAGLWIVQRRGIPAAVALGPGGRAGACGWAFHPDATGGGGADPGGHRLGGGL